MQLEIEDILREPERILNLEHKLEQMEKNYSEQIETMKSDL